MSASTTASAPAVEDVREYWNRRPCNIRHSQKEIGTQGYFDDVEARKYMVEPHIPGFAQFDRWKGKTVLEVGCGLGTDATNFARAGANYTGIELSESSLDLAKKRFDVFGLNGKFQAVNAEELDRHLPHETYDLVYSFGVIHHTPNPRAVIEAIRKVIRDDGEFRMMMYAKRSWKSAMIEAGLDQPEAQSGCPVAFTYTEDEIRELVKGEFEVTQTYQDHIFPYVVEKYVKYEYEYQPWFKAMPEDMFRALEKTLGWHMMITCKPI